MKVVSVNFITSTDKIPTRQRDTEFGKLCQQWFDMLKHPQAKLGLKLETKDAKGWNRYAIQRKLQKMGARIVVSSGERGFFYILPIQDKK